MNGERVCGCVPVPLSVRPMVTCVWLVNNFFHLFLFNIDYDGDDEEVDGDGCTGGIDQFKIEYKKTEYSFANCSIQSRPNFKLKNIRFFGFHLKKFNFPIFNIFIRGYLMIPICQTSFFPQLNFSFHYLHNNCLKLFFPDNFI